MTLLKKDVPHLDGGARMLFFNRFCGAFPKYWLFSVSKWGISPISLVILEFFQWSLLNSISGILAL